MPTARVTFRVLDRLAPRKAVDPGVGRLSDRIAAEVTAATPRRTGRLQAGWTVSRGRFHAVRLLTNDVPYARFVEYGTKRMAARPALGRTLARYRWRR